MTGPNDGPGAESAKLEEAQLEAKASTPTSASDDQSSPGASVPPTLPGNLQAWTQVMSAFLVFFNTW